MRLIEESFPGACRYLASTGWVLVIDENTSVAELSVEFVAFVVATILVAVVPTGFVAAAVVMKVLKPCRFVKNPLPCELLWK